MKSLYENITDTEYATLKSILETPNWTPADFFFDEPTIDGIVEELINGKLVTMSTNGELQITELGRSALKEHDYAIAQRIKAHRIETLKFLIPIVISVASLIVSIIALIK